MSEIIGLGFDSGGSRTTYAVDRGRGAESQGASEAAVSIADARGEASTRAAVDWIKSVVLEQEEDDVVVWIGCAGFAAATARAIAERFAPAVREIARHFEQTSRHCEIYITNDAVAILKAPPLNGAGVAAIVGTGSVVLGAHPKFPNGIIKRGGSEWLVSDEGSGVWMTLQCVRLLLRDIQTRGSQDYHSVLLDRLADFVGVTIDSTEHIPDSHRAIATAELIARKMSENRADAKKFYASFVHPNIFDMAMLDAGRPYDPIAAEVLNQSVQVIVDDVRTISDELAAHTADEANLREPLPLVVGGKIAAHPYYEQLLRATIASNCRFISSVQTIGDAADEFAALSVRYLRADTKTRTAITRAFDPLHPIERLL